MSIKIITDSACSLSKEVVEELDITVVPLTLQQGEESFIDGVDIDPEAMMNEMKEGKVYKTSQVSPAAFEEVFDKYINIYDTVIYIAFSSEISGTYQGSVIAKNHLLEKYEDIKSFDLEVIDTKCVALGSGLIVMWAAEMAKAGKNKEQIMEAVHYYSQNMEHVFTVDDLNYLYRGGRVSYTSAFVGGLLNIKPILNVEEGKLIPLEKIRSRKKALKRIVEIVRERGVNLDKQLVGINHGNDQEGAELLREMLEAELGVKKFMIQTLPGVIAAHTGPGTLSVFFLSTGMKDFN